MYQKLNRLKGKLNFRKIVPDYFQLTIGSIILVVNFNLFLAPFNIPPGGVSGAAIIIYKYTEWLPGITMLVLMSGQQYD